QVSWEFSYRTISRAFAFRRPITRTFTPRRVKTSTCNRPLTYPTAINRTSPYSRLLSSFTEARDHSKSFTLSKEALCLAKFLAAFPSSHSYSYSIAYCRYDLLPFQGLLAEQPHDPLRRALRHHQFLLPPRRLASGGAGTAS